MCEEEPSDALVAAAKQLATIAAGLSLADAIDLFASALAHAIRQEDDPPRAYFAVMKAVGARLGATVTEVELQHPGLGVGDRRRQH